MFVSIKWIVIFLEVGLMCFFFFVFVTCDNSFGGSMSQVDILVATPGRLVDHITSTPNFTLEHLRFLVIDEADRLLDQSYHGWLGKVLKAAYKTEHVNYTRSVKTSWWNQFRMHSKCCHMHIIFLLPTKSDFTKVYIVHQIEEIHVPVVYADYVLLHLLDGVLSTFSLGM